MLEILGSQLIDPFRIGLVFFLLVTALRTRANTGLAMPLAMGVIFVAVLLPLTTGAGAVSEGADRFIPIAVGIVANAVILACFLSFWFVWTKARQ